MTPTGKFTAEKTVVECAGVSHTYARNGRGVLRNVDLAVRAGEIVSIVGASGCGKTTLLRILAGLLSPTGGSVRINGRPVAGAPDPECALVFQADRLYPWRTALKNVAFGLELRGLPKREVHDRSMAALELVGLAKHARQFPSELSGGMRQRVNIARALAVHPRVLLMDEPFASLDAQTRELMQQELLRILERSGISVVFVTHQIDEAVYLSDRVVVLVSEWDPTVRRVVDIPLSRPRPLSTKRSVEAVALFDLIWHDIEEDVLRNVMA